MKKIKWFEGHGRGYTDKGGYRSDTFCDGRLSRQYIVYEISEEEYRLDLILRTAPTVYLGDDGVGVISNGTVTLGDDFRSFDAVEEFVSDFEAKFGPDYDFGPDVDEYFEFQDRAIDYFNIIGDSDVGVIVKEGFKVLDRLKIFYEYDLPVKSVEDMVKIWEIVEILRNKPLPENLHLSEDQENRFAAAEYFGKIF